MWNYGEYLLSLVVNFSLWLHYVMMIWHYVIIVMMILQYILMILYNYSPFVEVNPYINLLESILTEHEVRGSMISILRGWCMDWPQQKGYNCTRLHLLYYFLTDKNSGWFNLILMNLTCTFYFYIFAAFSSWRHYQKQYRRSIYFGLYLVEPGWSCFCTLTHDIKLTNDRAFYIA